MAPWHFAKSAAVRGMLLSARKRGLGRVPKLASRQPKYGQLASAYSGSAGGKNGEMALRQNISMPLMASASAALFTYVVWGEITAAISAFTLPWWQ